MKKCFAFQLPGSTILIRYILIVWALLIISCAPKTPVEPVRPERLITLERPYGPTVSLEQFLDETLSRQYSDLDFIFKSPDSISDYGLVLISRERPVLALDRGVVAFTADNELLAAGYDDGNIRVWSDFPCPMVALPDNEPVSRIWRSVGSPYIAAAGESDPSWINIFDLNRCARIMDISVQAPVDMVSVSPMGSRLALVDEGGRLWTGNPKEDLEQQATLRFRVLDMAFTPREGVLMLADMNGWLILWSADNYSVLQKELVPGGPFDRAFFNGPELILFESGSDSAQAAWSVPESRIIASSLKMGVFELENGVMYYTLPDKQLVKKVHMAGSEFTVLADQENMVLEITDLDGTVRNYCAVSGTEISSPPEPSHQEQVKVFISGSFSWSGIDYCLADPVIAGEQGTLWSRHIPGSGHYLWWSADTFPEYREFNSKLPLRDNIRKEIPPEWETVDY